MKTLLLSYYIIEWINTILFVFHFAKTSTWLLSVLQQCCSGYYIQFINILIGDSLHFGSKKHLSNLYLYIIVHSLYMLARLTTDNEMLARLGHYELEPIFVRWAPTNSNVVFPCFRWHQTNNRRIFLVVVVGAHQWSANNAWNSSGMAICRVALSRLIEYYRHYIGVTNEFVCGVPIFSGHPETIYE